MNNTKLTEAVLITENGYQLLKNKLIDLEKQSKIVSDKLKYARIDGDLSENAEWKVLRENLEITHDKIIKIRKDLENSNIIQGNDNNNNSIRIGNKVLYSIVGKDESLEVEITSEIEANPFINKISYLSPLGSSLMNKGVGEVIEIKNSRNLNNYQIKVIEVK
ncbi:MAG: Transcription elongation factor GreA [Mycoplasmataceae bacterium]|nr:MAG: Transcription elongation factor GreA [Mycoplasmataceae bacterium]